MLSHRRGWAGLDLWFRRCNIPPPAQLRHLCHPCKRASHVVHGTDGINAQLPQHGTAPHAQQSRVAARWEQQAIATPEKSDQHSQGQPYPGQHAQQQLEQQQNQGNAKEGQHVGRLRRRPARGGRGTKAGSVQADPAERGQQADSDPDMPKQSVQAMQHVQQQGSTAAAGQGRRGGRAAPTRHSMRRLRGGEGFSGDGEEQEGGVRTVSRKGQRLALAGPQNPGGASSPPTPCLDGRATLGGDEAGADPASAGGLLDPNTPQLQGCNDRGVQGGPGGGVANDTSAAATNSGGSKKGGSEAGSGRRTGSPTRRRREGGHSGRSKTVRGSIGSSKHQPRKAGGGGSSGGGGGGGTPPPTWYASAEALALLRGIGVKEEAVARVVAEAAPHIPSDRGSQLDRAGVEAACEFLIQAVGVPAGKLAGVVEGAPEVLAVGVEELGSRVQLLRTLWQGRRANLAAAVQEQPEVLCRAFFSQLGPSLDALTSLGFSRDQACGAVARYPPLVLQRRYELAAALRQAGAAPGEAPPQVYTLLAKYPRLLSKEGCPELRPALRVLRECGLEGEHALHALADWPMLARMPVQRVRGAVNILRSNGFKEGDVAAVLRGFPQIAGVDVRRIKTVLSLLRAAGIPYQRAVQYPRVFLHDPANYTGPRLAYLKAHQPGRAEELQLVSILSRSDAEFAEARGNIPLEEYLLFKDRWLALYGHRFGLTPEQADPMRRRLREQLAEEVTGSLFSTIPWDSL